MDFQSLIRLYYAEICSFCSRLLVSSFLTTQPSPSPPLALCDPVWAAGKFTQKSGEPVPSAPPLPLTQATAHRTGQVRRAGYICAYTCNLGPLSRGGGRPHTSRQRQDRRAAPPPMQAWRAAPFSRAAASAIHMHTSRHTVEYRCSSDTVRGEREIAYRTFPSHTHTPPTVHTVQAL
jgi:hypothetical protein